MARRQARSRYGIDISDEISCVSGYCIGVRAGPGRIDANPVGFLLGARPRGVNLSYKFVQLIARVKLFSRARIPSRFPRCRCLWRWQHRREAGMRYVRGRTSITQGCIKSRRKEIHVD